jgi:hypothetical protein
MSILENFEPAVKSGRINPRWRISFKEQGEALMSLYPEAETISEAYYRAKNNLEQRPVCLTCSGKVSFSAKNHSYSRFCSPRCGQNNIDVRTKLECTNLKKYGHTNVGKFGSDEHKAGLLSKYGVEHPMYSSAIKENLERTNLEKYGTKNVFASPEVKEKIKETFLKKYGVSHNMRAQSVKDKFRDENGIWATTKGIITRSKSRSGNEIHRISERLETYGFTILETISPLHNHKNKQLIQHSCGHIFKTALANGIIPICRSCTPKLVGTSILQKSVEDIVYETGIPFEIANRTILGRKEIDILIRSKNLGIEVNGLYWHSEGAGKDKDWHLDKTKLAESAGINLIHFFEDDIIFKPLVVKSIIRAKLGLSNKVFARKCKIVFPTKNEGALFCAANHLKGSARFDFAVGLEYNGTLVCCATIAKPRYSKKADFELIRFCSALGTVVVGGLSKILKSGHIQGTLISYADRCISTGNVYIQCGFTLTKILPPNFWYFKGPENKRTHQTQLRKYKLIRKDKSIDDTKTEAVLLQEDGWLKVWDCGNLEFIINLEPRLNN